MIEHLYAIVAGRAVTGSRRSVYFTGRTLFPFRVGFHQIFISFSSQKHEYGSSRDDSGIGAGGEVVEDGGDGDAEEEDDGEGGGDLVPDLSEDEDAEEDGDDGCADVPAEVGAAVGGGSGDAFLAAETVAAWPDFVKVGHVGISCYFIIIIGVLTIICALIITKVLVVGSSKADIYGW